MALLPNDPLFLDPTNVPAVSTRHGDTYDIDLDTGQFADDGGEVAVISGATAFSQALEKILQTRRAQYLAYTHDYGHDYGAYLDGDPAATATRQGLLLAYITDALNAHPRVRQVFDVTVEVLDLGTNEVNITATVLDTFGSEVALDHTLNA